MPMATSVFIAAKAGQASPPPQGLQAMRRFPAFACTGVFLLAVCLLVYSAHNTPGSPRDEMLAVINQARKQKGVPSLVFSAELQKAAQKLSDEGRGRFIMRSDAKSDSQSGSASCGSTMVAQKVPDWYTITYKQFLDRSLKEPALRQMMLSRSSTHMGFAVAGAGKDVCVTLAVGQCTP